MVSLKQNQTKNVCFHEHVHLEKIQKDMNWRDAVYSDLRVVNM